MVLLLDRATVDRCLMAAVPHSARDDTGIQRARNRIPSHSARQRSYTFSLARRSTVCGDPDAGTRPDPNPAPVFISLRNTSKYQRQLQFLLMASGATILPIAQTERGKIRRCTVFRPEFCRVLLSASRQDSSRARVIVLLCAGARVDRGSIR